MQTAVTQPTPLPLAQSGDVTGGARGAEQSERLLIRRYHGTRDRQLQDQLVRRHERLVWSIAWRYRSAGEPIEDLAQEGFVGLLRAIASYDISSPAKFSSYAAMKITGSIEHYLRDRSATIRQPGWLQELQGRIRREERRMAQALGRAPTLGEIASSLDLSEERVVGAIETTRIRTVGSLDEPPPGADPEGPSLGEVIPDAARNRERGHLEERIDLERAMGVLDDQQRRALRLCFFDDLTFEEAGGRMGMDRHRARRLVTGAMKLLRRQLQAA